MEDDYRTFVHLSRAWYGPANIRTDRYVDEVMLGFHLAGGEIAMRWYELSGRATPKLELFNDSFRALSQMPDLISALADADNVDFTPDEFCRLLVRLGFRDETPVDDERQASLEKKIRALVASERSA